MPSIQGSEPMQRIVQQVADCFSENGFAFVEDDKLGALEATLTSFLIEADIPICTSGGPPRHRRDASS